MTLLRDLNETSGGLQWHEAVALALDVAEKLRRTGGACPLIDHLGMASDGSTLELPGARYADDPVLGLGAILSELLDSTRAPKPLVELVAAAKVPGVQTLDGVIGHLRFFERPDRGANLAALAGRVKATDAARVAAKTLDDLQERTRKSAEQKQARASGPPAASAKNRIVRRTIVLVSGVMLIGAAASLFWMSPNPMPQLSLPALSWLETRLVPVKAPEPLPAAAAADVPVRGRGKRQATVNKETRLDLQAEHSSVAVESQDDLAPDALPESEPVRVYAVEVLPTEAHVPPISVDSFVEGLGAVYSGANLDVAPARLLHKKLPSSSSTDVRQEEVGEFDLVVNEQGEVERVRLVSKRNLFHERMLLAAAKAWRFVPAQLDGTPVKYRTQIRIPL